MNKIVCPTDFSPIANNAVEYAASLCRLFNARLELVNVQFADPVELHDSKAAKEIPAVGQLEETCRLVRENFGIHCSIDIEVPQDNLATTLAAAAYDADLVVMGTGGMNEVYEYFFGTYTYNVVKKTTCPVLIVPEGFSYHPMKKTILAWDYNEKTKDNFLNLGDFWKIFGQDIVFLHVSKHSTEASKDIFRLAKQELEEKLGHRFNYSFDRACSQDVVECIDEYMLESNADMLVMAAYDRGFIGNLFHGQALRELVNRANYPMLVFHTRK